MLLDAMRGMDRMMLYVFVFTYMSRTHGAIEDGAWAPARRLLLLWISRCVWCKLCDFARGPANVTQT